MSAIWDHLNRILGFEIFRGHPDDSELGSSPREECSSSNSPLLLVSHPKAQM